ncbi:hydrophobin 3 precursor [Ophiocordyceps camponoti-floridani]|uniref:Hydrophobin 3 n=1 Tax=Ophiocordyceps camponoti-floridani TaxID=2030778 RepID=A0A8H4VDT1_9HYPO|nr:hydrophobin 3 precursor [Ophiocordyceps camponoti-floridani]
MKFLAIVALATVAIAAPADVEPRSSVNKCNVSSQQQVCCNGLLGCVVQILGSSCANRAYCCDSNGPSTGGLININGLNCVNLSG